MGNEKATTLCHAGRPPACASQGVTHQTQLAAIAQTSTQAEINRNVLPPALTGIYAGIRRIGNSMTSQRYYRCSLASFPTAREPVQFF